MAGRTEISTGSDYSALPAEPSGQRRNSDVSVLHCLPAADQTLHQDLLNSLLGHDAEVVLEDIVKDHPALHRRLTLLDGVSVVVGVIIGSGIFASPGVVLADVGSIGLSLVAWLLGGLVALCSALIYAELGSAIPHAGGDSEYLRMAFGYPWSFAFIWTMFFVLKSGSLAILSITFARYLASQLFSLDIMEPALDSDPRVKVLAVACIAIITILNCFGVHVGSWLQNIFTLSKFILVLLLVSAAAVFLGSDTSVVAENASNAFQGSRLGGLGPGMIAAAWAFDGWNDIIFLSEELNDPARDLPKAVFLGMFTVTTTYFLINISYLCVLPAAGLKASKVIALDVVQRAFGHWAGSAAALLVAASVFGTVNGSILCGGRYLYAAAREGQIPRFMGSVHKSTGAPHTALLTQGAWGIAALLVPASRLETLIEYFGIASWLFYGLTAAAMMKLRRDNPELHRPYSVPLHPLAPLFLIAVAGCLVVTSFINGLLPSALSIAFVCMSFPVYYLFFRRAEDPRVLA